MRLLPIFLALLIPACSDYKITPDPDDPTGLEDTGRPDDVTPPEDTETPGDTDTFDTKSPEDTGTFIPEDDCPTELIPGFETEVDDACENDVETGTFTPVVEWSVSSFFASSSYNNVMMQPIVASLTDDNGDGDIDDDDIPDIIFTSYTGSSWTSAGVLRAVSGDGSGSIFDDSATGIQGSGSLAAGDIDGDGVVEIIAVTASTFRVVAFENDGTVKWQSSSNVVPSSCYTAAPALADLEGDGDVEIVVGGTVLEHDGTVRFTVTGSIGTCASFPADVDGDGDMEIIAGDALYDHRGNLLWNASSVSDGYPAIADFDLDGTPEIVVVSGSTVYLLESATGAVRWSRAAGSGPPTVADYDGDGLPEVGVAGSSTYTVLDTDGTILWQNSTTDASSGRTGSSVFDFEGDGVAEVIYADEYTIWVYSGVDGSVKLEETNHTSWTWIEYSVVADVDGDGHAEIIAPHGQISSTTSGAVYGLSIIGDLDDSWQPGRKIWNQHAYSITNINDDGTVPRFRAENWLSYNNFRSGDLTAGSGTDAPDAIVIEGELCEIDCDENTLIVYVHPGNQGLDDLLAGGRVELWVETPGGFEAAAVQTLPAVPSGEVQDALRFEITAYDPSTLLSIEARIVSVEPECDEDNNVVVWEGPFCE